MGHGVCRLPQATSRLRTHCRKAWRRSSPPSMVRGTWRFSRIAERRHPSRWTSLHRGATARCRSEVLLRNRHLYKDRSRPQPTGSRREQSCGSTWATSRTWPRSRSTASHWDRCGTRRIAWTQPAPEAGRERSHDQGDQCVGQPVDRRSTAGRHDEIHIRRRKAVQGEFAAAAIGVNGTCRDFCCHHKITPNLRRGSQTNHAVPQEYCFQN